MVPGGGGGRDGRLGGGLGEGDQPTGLSSRPAGGDRAGGSSSSRVSGGSLTGGDAWNDPPPSSSLPAFWANAKSALLGPKPGWRHAGGGSRARGVGGGVTGDGVGKGEKRRVGQARACGTVSLECPQGMCGAGGPARGGYTAD